MRRAADRCAGRRRLVETGDEKLRRDLAVGIREDFGDRLPVGSVGWHIESQTDPVVSAESRDEETLRVFRDEFVAGAGRRGGPERDMAFVEPALLRSTNLANDRLRTNQVSPLWVNPSVTSGSAMQSRRTLPSSCSVAGDIRPSSHSKAQNGASTLGMRLLNWQAHSDLAARRGGGL